MELFGGYLGLLGLETKFGLQQFGRTSVSDAEGGWAGKQLCGSYVSIQVAVMHKHLIVHSARDG